MMYDKLLEILRECNDCICEEHCPYYEERTNPLKCMTKIVGDAADAIEELQNQVPKWIPVSERLPEQNTRVIGFMAWKGITAIEYQNGNWYSIDHLQPLPNEAVTHWMPLPELPKEGE